MIIRRTESNKTVADDCRKFKEKQYFICLDQ